MDNNRTWARTPTLQEIAARMSEHWRRSVTACLDDDMAIGDPVSLAEQLSRYETVQAMAVRLGSQEQEVLAAWIKRYGDRPERERIAAEELELDGLLPPQIRASFMQLRQHGVFISLVNRWRENAMCLPAETFRHWHRILLPDLDADGSARERSTVHPASDRGGLFQSLFVWMVCVAKHELKWSKDGRLYKQHRRKLAQWMEAWTNPGNRSLNADEIGMTWLHIALSVELVQVCGGRLVWNETNWFNWLDDPWREQKLYDMLRSRFLPRAAAFGMSAAHFVYWTERLEPGRKVQFDDYVEWARHYGLLCGNEDLNALYEHIKDHWLNPMEAFGWLKTASAGQLHRGALPDIRCPEPTSSLYVQPNFEIIVMPEADWKTRWHVEMLAERVDSGVRYTITQASATEACKWKGADQWCLWLHNYSKSGLPDAVAETIRSWMRTGPVERHRMTVGRTNELLEQEDIPNTINRAGDEWVLDPVYPSVDRMYPELKRIPSIWTSAVQSFHPSTTRDIIRKAIELNVLVELELNDERRVKLWPEQLRVDRERWSVAGLNEQRIPEECSVDQISKLRLCIPGIDSG